MTTRQALGQLVLCAFCGLAGALLFDSFRREEMDALRSRVAALEAEPVAHLSAASIPETDWCFVYGDSGTGGGFVRVPCIPVQPSDPGPTPAATIGVRRVAPISWGGLLSESTPARLTLEWADPGRPSHTYAAATGAQAARWAEWARLADEADRLALGSYP